MPDNIAATVPPSTETFSPGGTSWNELVILGLTPAGATPPSVVAHGIVTLPAGGSVQTPGLNVKAGDAVFIGWNQFATTPVSVTDSEGNTYTGASVTYVTTRQLGYAYVVNVAASSSLVVTLRSSGSTGGANVYYVQVNGGGTTVQSSGFTPSSSASLTPAAGNERLVIFGALVPVASPTLSPGTYLDKSTSGTWNSFSGTDVAAPGGSLTLPQLVSFVANTVPEFGLLYVAGSTLQYQVGTYSSSVAKAILNGTTTNHLPLSWGGNQIIAYGGAPFTADALATSSDGSVLAAAATYSGITYTYLSTNGGANWAGLSSVSGANPQLALGSSLLAVAETGNALSIETFGLASPHSALTYSVSGNFESAVPAWVPNGALGEEAVAATTTAGAVIFYDSVDGGHTFTATTAGAFQNSPAPSAFGAVGSTRLIGPGGTPGQVAETVEGTTIFLLFTTSFEGRVAAATEISSNGGATWTGPWLTTLPVGSISNPRAVPSLAGDIYVTWTENSNQVTEVDQAVFAADGRLMEAPAPLPGSGGAGNASASAPAVTVDAFQRPLYIWTATPISGNSTLSYSGAFLSPANALGLVEAAVGGLSVWDMKPATSAQVRSTQTSAYTSISKLQKELADPSSNPCFPSDIQNNTSALYHNVTNVPLAYVNGSTDYCARLGPSVHPNSRVAVTAGAFAANTYLAVLLDWVDEGEAIPVQTAADALYSSPVGTPSGTTPALPPGATTFRGTTAYAGNTAEATVTAVPVNPTVGWLETSASFPTWQTLTTSGCLITEISYSFSSDTSNVTLEGGARQQFSGEPNVYLTNLTANATSSWTFALTITYRDVVTITTCDGHRHSSSGTFGFGTVTVGGTVTTTLRVLPGLIFIDNPAGTTTVGYHWNNSMEAQATVSLTNSGGSLGAIDNSYQIPENFGLGPNTFGDSYAAAISVTSQPGSWQAGMEPSVSAGQTTTSPAVSSRYACSFTLQQNHAMIAGFGITNLTGNTATVQWNSSAYGSGWVNVQELGVGLDWIQTAVEVNTTSPTAPYEYVVQLAGLLPLSLYGASAITSYSNDQCLVYEASHSQAFLTSNGFGLTEHDLPYDSISHLGGGAVVGWQLSPSLVSDGTLLNGTMAYWNNTGASQTVVVPIGSVTVPSRFGDSFWLNLTPSNPDQSYSAQVELNYSVFYQGSYGTFSGTFRVVSQPLTFTYLLDTTGDGLTDAEKWAGWFVPVANAVGPGYSSPPGTTWVGASPSLYATNGLVSDYVEKQFDLDPFTVDTARSHMLDTWNLTFNLGSAGIATLPTSAFAYWYENGSFNPFSGTTPAAFNSTNITASVTHGITSGDGSPWAAKALWLGIGTGNALATFEGLAGVRSAGWLRAVTGTWDGLRTLTVEGKLSWAADPLIGSNAHDGVPDGARIDPLYERYLSITGLYATLSNCGSYVPSSGTNGWAVRFWLNASSGPQEIANYSEQSNISSKSSCGSITGFTVTIPVNQTYQYQSLQVQLVVNNSGKLQMLPVSGTATKAALTYDMVKGAVSSFSYTGSNGSSTTLGFNIQGVRAGLKTPTYLWLPKDNGTITANPWGLKSYVGEQAFDLVVVQNSGNTFASDGIPFPWGSTYTTNLATGLTNFLVPRGQFLNSSLGRAVLLGVTLPYTNSSNPPLIASGSGSEGSLLTGFGGANLMTDLGCYWQNRAISSSSGAICSTSETGTIDSNSANVRLATAGYSSSNAGRVPGNPTLENSSDAGAALQAVLTLNVSNQNELDLLLAALLDNVTGGVNGSFQNVALYVPSLGVPNAVLAALANLTTTSVGLYGLPQDAGHSGTSSGPVWGLLWNSFSGLVDKVIAGVQSVVSVVYNAAVATLHFFENLPQALAKWGETAIARVASALKAAGNALRTALNTLVGIVVSGVKTLLTAVVSPIGSALKSVIHSWMSTLFAATNATIASYAGSGSLGRASAETLPAVVGQVLAGSAFAIVTMVAVGVISPLSLGAGFLLPIILQVAVLAFSVSPLNQPSGGFVQQILSLVLGSSTYGLRMFSSLSEHVFNLTHTITSSAAMAFVVPGVSGDYWAQLGLVTALVAIFAALAAAVKASSSNSISDEATNAGSALIFAFIAIVFLIAELSVSLFFPSYNSYAYASMAGLAAGSAIFGAFAMFYGARGIGGDGLLLPILAGVGTLLGAVAIFFAYEDIQTIFNESP